MTSARSLRSLILAGVILVPVLGPARALAVGESINGFPNWAERVLHEWMNRARVDPQVEMAACGSACADAACYGPMPPLAWAEALNHSARFHSANMTIQGYLTHNSSCTLVSNISQLFPGSCDGSASCACVGGVNACNPSCTTWAQRIVLFGAVAGGEVISSRSDPNDAFYRWLFETASTGTCQFTEANGHRWLILAWRGTVGAGMAGRAVADFSSSSPIAKIPSGSHYPQQAASVEAWANWYDAAGPMSAKVNVDGVCWPMALRRGSPQNGAYMATISGVATGCHRYYFSFKDSSGATVTYPTTGSLGIGDAACTSWSSSRPPVCGGGCN